MGTEFVLRISAKEGSADDLTLLSRRVFDRIAELNQIFSDYLPESELNDLARSPVGEPFPVSADLFAVLAKGKELSERTNGAFDLTAGPVIRLWRISRKNRSLPTPEQIARAQARTGAHLIELDPVTRSVTKHAEGMLFDLGGIAKGYAADEALRMLREAGYPRALVAASGDIAIGDPPFGSNGWKVGIESLETDLPENEMPTVELANAAISTSADTRQFIEIEGVRYSHIVNPETGLGLTKRIGVSVIAPEATTTDGHATAATLLGVDAGLRWIEEIGGVEARFVEERNGKVTVRKTKGFP